MLTQTADGNVETYEDFGGKTQYRYNEANRLTSLTAPDGKKTTYMNDNNDTRTSTTYPGGTWQSVTLDKSSRPTKIKTTNGDTTLIDLSHTYTSGGKTVDGTKFRTATEAVEDLKRTHTYDSADRGGEEAATVHGRRSQRRGVPAARRGCGSAPWRASWALTLRWGVRSSCWPDWPRGWAGNAGVGDRARPGRRWRAGGGSGRGGGTRRHRATAEPQVPGRVAAANGGNIRAGAGSSVIRWLDVHPDYARRAEPADILKALGLQAWNGAPRGEADSPCAGVRARMPAQPTSTCLVSPANVTPIVFR
ncbi:hypothetical protein ABZ820_20210 [Streptomyces diacarni]|uniref:hypothetical protein n=1 Tax=Streptomyces diacarni TaxID=2800381 RepID=UPI0033FF38D2